MAKVLKAAGLYLVVTIVVWLITIWHWQSTGHDASARDIVGQLFVLPVVLTLTLLLALWGVQRMKQGAVAQASSMAATPLTGAESTLAHPERDTYAWILAESAVLSLGSDADAAWSVLQAGEARPGLDSHLQDVDGMPVFTARIPGLSADEWLLAHAELLHDGQARVSDAVVRSLALLEEPLHKMMQAVWDMIPASMAGDAPGPYAVEGHADLSMTAHLSGVAQAVSRSSVQAQAVLAPRLTVRLLWPAHWLPADQALATQWVRSQCGVLLDWAEAMHAQALVWRTDPLDSPEALWDEVDEHIVQWSRDPRPQLLLLLSVDSAVNEARVAHMQAVGELFTATHQTGRIPGEAASALLLAHAQWGGLAERVLSPVQCRRPVRARRDKSADAAGRIGCTTLSAALAHAMQQVQAQPASLLVVSDADHRASRTSELFEALQEVAPEVDPMQQVARIGAACGDMGVARALVPAALACAALRQSNVPQAVALATHVQSSHERVVVALRPWAPESVSA